MASAEPAAGWRRHLPLALGLLVALAVLAQPLLLAPGRSGSTDDWRWFSFHWEVSRSAVLDQGQLPVWNPYHCGGGPQLANPQTQDLSPLAWPALLIGVPAGLKLFLLLHLLLGYGAMFWLARDLGLRRWPAALAATLFCGSGYFFMHLGGGHSSFAPFYLMPGVLAAYRRSLADLRWTVAAGAGLALMVLEGGVYPVPYTALLLGVYATGLLLRRPGGLRPLLALALVAGLAGALAGVKLLPVLAFLQERPRLVPSDDGMSLGEVVLAFASRRLERKFAGHPYVWPEYGAYLGLPVLLAVLALAWTRARTYLGWLLLTGLFVLLMTGNRSGGFSPHEVLRELPILRSLHVPSRFGVVVTLGLAWLAAAALQEALDALARCPLRPGVGRWARGALVVLACLCVLDVLSFGQWQMGRFKDLPSRAPAAAGFRMTGAPWAEASSFPRRGIGTLACYEPNGLPRGKVRAGLPAEAFVAPPPGAAADAPPPDAEVRVLRWSPARVEVEATLRGSGGALIVLNQNDHRGWTLESSPAAPGQPAAPLARAAHEGLPAARLAGPGTRRFAFAYHPPGLPLGAGLTLFGLLAAAGLLAFTPARQARLRGRLRGLLLAGPCPPGAQPAGADTSISAS